MPKAKFSATYKRMLRLLIEARRAAGLRQEDLAARLKRPQSYVSKIERGERRLDVGEFTELTKALKLDPVEAFRIVASTG